MEKAEYLDSAFTEAPASREQGRALHARHRGRRTQSVHARAERKRSWAAVLTGKTEDTLACLRGAVSGGAEKRKGSRTSETRSGFKVLFFWQLFLLLTRHLLLMTSRTVLFPPGVKAFHAVMAMLAEVLFG